MQKNTATFLFVLFLLVSIYFSDWLTIETIKNHKQLILNFIENNYLASVSLFFLSCIVFVNSPLPLAALIKLFGGFFFGFYTGALFNITATSLACIIGFLISRYAFKEQFEKFFYSRLKGVEKEIETNGFYYFLSLRVVMVVPYFCINFVAGISRISFKNYFVSTVIGVIPASLVYAHGGSQIEKINALTELFNIEVLLSFLLMVLLSLLPLLLKKLHALFKV